MLSNAGVTGGIARETYKDPCGETFKRETCRGTNRMELGEELLKGHLFTFHLGREGNLGVLVIFTA